MTFTLRGAQSARSAGRACLPPVSAAACFCQSLAKRLPLRPLYIAIGAVGGVSTLCLILLPRTPGSFALAMIGENVLQSLEIACSVAIAFETIGRDNPLAATTFALASAAYALPMVYMPVVDSWGYGRGGVADALRSTAAWAFWHPCFWGCCFFSYVALGEVGAKWKARCCNEGRSLDAAVRDESSPSGSYPLWLQPRHRM